MVRVLSPAGRESGGLHEYTKKISFRNKELDLGANFVEFRVPAPLPSESTGARGRIPNPATTD